MSTKPKTPQSQQGRTNAASIPVTNSSGLAPVYANNVGISATMFDFTLMFVETGQFPTQDRTGPRNELKAIVTLPIPSALSLMEALKQMVDSNAKAMQVQMDAVDALRKSSDSQ